ncbi:MAG: hypothetical protein Q9208_004961 [Pyrenodesmia sp. 3 TL-2023]
MGDKHTARQIYFIMLSMQNMVFANAVVSDQSEPAQMNMASMSEALASTFVWKHDDSVDRKCALMAGLAKAAIVTAFVVLGAVATPELLGIEATVAVTTGEAAAAGAGEAAAEGAAEGAGEGAAAGATAEGSGAPSVSVAATNLAADDSALQASPYTYVQEEAAGGGAANVGATGEGSTTGATNGGTANGGTAKGGTATTKPSPGAQFLGNFQKVNSWAMNFPMLVSAAPLITG